MKHSKLMTAAVLGILSVSAMAAQTYPNGGLLPAEEKEGCKGKDGCDGKKKEMFNSSVTAEEKEVGRVGRGIRSSGRTENSSSKHKKYLSLTKEVGADSKLQVSRSSSKEKKGIKLTPTQNHMKYSIAQFINYNDTSSNNRESTVIKKTAIRPRDLPRHSSQKIIPSVPFTIKTGFIPNQSAKVIPN